MKTHVNNQDVSLMIYEPKTKNEQIIKVNVKKGTELNVGDKILLKREIDVPFGFDITEITENRQSSLRDYNYVTCKANYGKI